MSWLCWASVLLICTKLVGSTRAAGLVSCILCWYHALVGLKGRVEEEVLSGPADATLPDAVKPQLVALKLPWGLKHLSDAGLALLPGSAGIPGVR